jgi:hypothetical protein
MSNIFELFSFIENSGLKDTPVNPSRDVDAFTETLYGDLQPCECQGVALGILPPEGSVTNRPIPPIKLEYFENELTLTDGNHRVAAARSKNLTHHIAVVRVYKNINNYEEFELFVRI